MRRFVIPLSLISGCLLIPAAAWEASVTQSLGITVTQSQSIASVKLSTSTFTGGAPSGTVVGAIGVAMSPTSPAFSGSLALSGTNAGKFQIAGTNLETNGIIPAGTYQINIVPTELGVLGSGTAYPFTITGDASSGLPPGVTLSAIDGETMTGNVMTHNYYARNGFTNAASSTFNPSYSNGGWDDPRFFPIGTDYPFYPNNSTTTYKSLGMNYGVRFTSDASIPALRTAGIYAIQDEVLSGTGSETVGFHIEEPANWSDITNAVQGFGSNLTGRFLKPSFTWTNLYYDNVTGAPGNGTMPVVMSSLISTSVGNRHLDIPTDDIYWFAASHDPTGWWQQYVGPPMLGVSAPATKDQMARGDHYGDMVDQMRPWVATYSAPIAPYIETEDGLIDSSPSPEILPQEFNWAAWSTIVHGARMLIYFGTTSHYGTQSTFGFGQNILPGASISMFNQAIALHTLVKNLAPIINSPFALSYASVTPVGYVFPTFKNYSLTNGIDIMAKWYTGGTYTNSTGTFNNGFYIFTTVRGSELQTNIRATVTIADANATTAMVVGEGRSIPISNRQFTDTFANAYTTHIYQVAYSN